MLLPTCTVENPRPVTTVLFLFHVLCIPQWICDCNLFIMHESVPQNGDCTLIQNLVNLNGDTWLHMRSLEERLPSSSSSRDEFSPFFIIIEVLHCQCHQDALELYHKFIIYGAILFCSYYNLQGLDPDLQRPKLLMSIFSTTFVQQAAYILSLETGRASK